MLSLKRPLNLYLVKLLKKQMSDKKIISRRINSWTMNNKCEGKKKGKMIIWSASVTDVLDFCNRIKWGVVIDAEMVRIWNRRFSGMKVIQKEIYKTQTLDWILIIIKDIQKNPVNCRLGWLTWKEKKIQVRYIYIYLQWYSPCTRAWGHWS